MLRIFFLPLLLCLLSQAVPAQAFSVDDLLALSSLSPKKFDHYLSQKGFFCTDRTIEDNATALTFLGQGKPDSAATLCENRKVRLFKKDNAYCFAFQTSSIDEFRLGKNRLRGSQQFYTLGRDTGSSSPLLFQYRNITIDARQGSEDGNPVYTFVLKKKELPALPRYAEDLLKFDSHEYLLSYFGADNVKTDVYYFSETKIKKCSVLFGNSNRQVVFVWEDEDNLCKLSYILISGILPTENGMPFNDNISRNKWVFRSGIYSGMSIRELLELNGRDFSFYGIKSEFSLMVEPVNTGYIDFKRTGVMLSCLDGTGSPLLKRDKINALDAVENRLALHVFYIVLAP